MTEETDPAAKDENFLDRAAYYDGKVDGLTEAVQAFNAAVNELEALGPMPTPNSPAGEVLVYQVKVATACGATFRRLGERLDQIIAEVKGERETLLRDLAVIRGESMN
jgi:hypothetical protein